MELNPATWSRLPQELVERVLSFLPTPDLCRLRSVSKQWSSLFRNPAFHDLCDRHRPSNAFLLVTRHLGHRDFTELDAFGTRSVHLLDLEAKRWYSLPVRQAMASAATIQLLTMDDGIVCEVFSWKRPDLDLAISDPARGIRKEFPEPPLFSHDDGDGDALPMVITSTDASSLSYTIFLINNASLSIPSPNRMCVYESSTGEWRALRKPSDSLQAGPALSGVMFGGALYVIFQRFPGQNYVLLKHNLQEDRWELVKVSIPKKRRHPQLVVSNHRLFVTLWLGEQSSHGHFHLSFQMRQVVVPQNSSRVVFQMARGEMQDLFAEEDADFDIAAAVPLLNSRGVCERVVLMSTLSGKLVEYHVRSGSVLVLPEYPQAARVLSEADYDAPVAFHQGQVKNITLRNLSARFLG